ncbi:MAG: thioesterase family protein [Rhodoblastus sp.]
MNLWLRLILFLIGLPFRPKLALPDPVSIRRYRVLPSDLDINLHMTNSRYPAFADIQQLDLFIRTGMMRAAIARGWRPMLLASKIRFRRELKAFRKFRVETRIRWWSDTSGIFEHRFITRGRDGSDIVAAVMLAKGCFYAPKDKRFVPFAEMLAALGLPLRDPPEPTPEILAFMQADEELRLAT